MRPPSTSPLVALTLLLSACGASTAIRTPDPQGDAASEDAAPSPDSTPNVNDAEPSPDASPPPPDAVVIIDAIVAPDASPPPPPDVPVASPMDVPPPIDIPRPPDVVVAPDVPRPPDAPTPPSIIGRWRVTYFEITDGRGMTYRFTDRNMPFRDPMTGATVPVRVNGVYTIERTRLSTALGTLVSDHFYPVDDASNAEGYSTSGYSVPGLLDDASGRFVIPGAPTPTTFDRNPDGTITLSDRASRSRAVFTRVTTTPLLTTFNMQGVVQIRNPARSAPMARPRAALLWDMPGGSTRVETHGTALTFSGAYAVYFVVLTESPPYARLIRVGAVAAGLAHLIVYDDVDNNRTYDPATDTLRGLSPVGIGWRGNGTPDATFLNSGLSDLQPGWQIVHVHQDYVHGGHAAVPYDMTAPPSPDIPVSETAIRTPIPDLIP